MFTGIVRELGEVVSVEEEAGGIRLRIEAPAAAAEGGLGESVSVNGACLTIVAAAGGVLEFQAVPETMARTSLGMLEPGSRVNIEPALRGDQQLGGHFVQGHVDGVGAVRSVEPEGTGRRLAIDAPPEILRYCVEKGSVTVEGVSLTVAALDDRCFEVALIPHTLEVTTLGALTPGDPVNLEADVLAKYVERLLPLPRGSAMS